MPDGNNCKDCLRNGAPLCDQCDAGDLFVAKEDAVNHPKHYCQNPKGIETIDFIEHMSYNLGNAVKYISRCEHKGKFEEDLNKAIWYLKRELERKANG